MLITITGPSGVGKTTLYNNLRNSLTSLVPLVSTTTRAPRPTDEEGFEYVTDEEFDALEKEGAFLWAVFPHGKKYATRKKVIEEAFKKDSISILVIEAVKKLHEYAPGKILSFYIEISDDEELRRRFHTRGDMTEEEIENRIKECRSWNKEARESGVPFVFLDGRKTPEELRDEVLKLI